MPISYQELVQDERLQRLFDKHGYSCALQLWLLQIKVGDVITSRLLYGRFLPYSFSNNRWSAPNEDRYKRFGRYEAQVIRINLYCTSNKSRDLLEMLTHGHDIASASFSVGIDLPDVMRGRFSHVQIGCAFCYRPVAYLPMRDTFGEPGLKSPHHAAGAFSASITNCEKYALFKVDGTIDEVLLAHALDYLYAETGMQFKEEDATRLGDLELLVFPTLDDHERNLLNVELHRSQSTLNVKLEPNSYHAYENFVVRAHFVNDDQIVHSGIARRSSAAGDAVNVTFPIPAHLESIIDGCKVEIHAYSLNEAEAVLYARWTAHYVREINISGVLRSGSATVKSDWLSKFTKGSNNAQRIEQAQTGAQTGLGFSSRVGGREADSWVEINRELASQLNKFLPPKSEGMFFEKYGDGDGLGRLEFAEWMKRLFGIHKDKRIVIFDPYFEDAGIALLIPNASSAGDYIVITTDRREKKPAVVQKNAEDKKTDRLDNLLLACDKLKPLARRVRLRIFALPDEPLHDRYILVIGQDGQAVAGFHLSNSIQRATENYPLLITPIPDDVLLKVVSYSAKVLDRAMSSTVETKTATSSDNCSLLIYDSAKTSERKESRHRYEQMPFLNDPVAGDVLAAWLGNRELAGLSSVPLREKLTSFGVLVDDALDKQQFLDLQGLYRLLSEDDSGAFDKHWQVAGSVLAYTPAGDALDSTSFTLRPGFLQSLVLYLRMKFVEACEVSSDDLGAFGYANQMTKPLVDLFSSARQYYHFHHHIKFNGLSWAEFYAIKILWSNDGAALIRLMEEKAELLPQEPIYDDKETKLYAILAQAINEIALSIEFGLDEAHICQLISSNCSFLKWLGCCALESILAQDVGAFARVGNDVGLLNDQRIVILGWMINRASLTSDRSDLFATLVKEFLLILPPRLEKSDAIDIIDAMRGHMRELGWCEPWLYQHIVAPLIYADRVNVDDMAAIWMADLGKSHQQLLKGISGSFSLRVEGRATNTTAFLLANSSYAYQQAACKELKKALASLKSVIRKPLASTTQWERWDASLKAALWILGLVRWTYNYLPLPNRFEIDLLGLYNDAQDLSMTRPISEWQAFDYPEIRLTAFLKDVTELQ